MKNCPDIDRLIDLTEPGNRDLEAQAHVQGCDRCRAELRLIRDIPAAMRAPVPVDPSLIQRTLDEIERVARDIPAPSRRPSKAASVATTGALSTVTILAGIFASEIPDHATLSSAVLYSAMLGAAAAAWQYRREEATTLG